MARILAQNASLVFPLFGSDQRHGGRFRSDAAPRISHVGGEIISSGDSGFGVRAISDVSLDVKTGDRLGIVGHNGAGKSSLLRLLGGVYAPTSGKVHIDGRVSGLYSLTLGMNREATGFENIELKGLMFGLRRREVRALLPEIMEFSELGDYLYMPIKTYSSGMVMRLMFSIASALKPDILLLDEWISSSDKSFRAKVDSRLEEMVERTPIVIIASHDEDRLGNWADEVVHLQGGQVISAEAHAESRVTPQRFSPSTEALNYHKLLLNMGETQRALDNVGMVWPNGKASLNYHMNKAILLAKLNRNDEAIEAYEEALNCDPADPRLHDQLGRVYLKIGAAQEAAEHLIFALEVSEGRVGHTGSLMTACEMIGEPKKAEILINSLRSKHLIHR